MLTVAEKLAVFSLGENVACGIDACLVEVVKADKMVSYLVGGIREHKYDLLKSHCDALKADRETVTRKDRENNRSFTAGEFCAYVLCDLFNTCVVTLCTGNDSLRNCDNVAVADLDIFRLCGCKNAVRYDSRDIIACSDYGCANAS